MPIPSLLLIHGAASGAWVWDLWRKQLSDLGWQVNVLDLRGHGRSLPIDLSAVTMEDYVADVASVTQQIEAAQGVHPIVCGWSMGGMVAMMYATQHEQTPALLLMEPSPPLEITGRVDMDTLRRFSGTVLTPESFGIYPGDPDRSRERLFDLTPEELAGFLAQSKGAEEGGLVFRQNLRGMSIPAGSITCPVLVLYGESRRTEIAGQNRRLAEYLGGESLAVPEASHWGIVAHEAAVTEAAPAVDTWLRRVTSAAGPS